MVISVSYWHVCVTVYIEMDQNDDGDDVSVTGSYIERMYPNMGLIDDDHELNKPRTQPESRLQ